jgi:SAM-dependent methyltransferase
MSISNEDFYLGAYKKFGQTPKGLNWNSKESQEIRFEVITEFLKDELKNSVIADAGCGFADLYAFWQANEIKVKKYIGIDSMELFVSISQKKFPQNFFTCKDILKESLPLATWYVASGSLNILSDFQTWLFLENMLNHSKKGIVFNILCGDKKSKTFNYKTIDDIMLFANKKALHVEIKEGYLKNDMTVKMTL